MHAERLRVIRCNITPFQCVDIRCQVYFLRHHDAKVRRGKYLGEVSDDDQVRDEDDGVRCRGDHLHVPRYCRRVERASLEHAVHITDIVILSRLPGHR